eukprot:2027880-Rhodomonas_salina.1
MLVREYEVIRTGHRIARAYHNVLCHYRAAQCMRRSGVGVLPRQDRRSNPESSRGCVNTA